MKVASIMDAHTPECVGGLVERSITATRLVDDLDRELADEGRAQCVTVSASIAPSMVAGSVADFAQPDRVKGTARA